MPKEVALVGYKLERIEINLRKENWNFILTQHNIREHGSTSRKLAFSFAHPVVEENK